MECNKYAGVGFYKLKDLARGDLDYLVLEVRLS